jgi:hypothetical protein
LIFLNNSTFQQLNSSLDGSRKGKRARHRGTVLALSLQKS